MRQTAIITYGNPDAAVEAAALLNEGNKIHVAIVAIDSQPSESLSATLAGLGAAAIPVPADADGWADLALRLNAAGVTLVVRRSDSPDLPTVFLQGFAGNVIEAAEGESFQKALIDAVRGGAADVPAEKASAQMDEERAPDTSAEADDVCTPKQKSVDREWADVLQMEFDEKRAAEAARKAAESTETPPPPLPGGGMPPFPGRQSFYGQPQGAPQETRQYGQPRPGQQQPPMPDTYLVWSVLATIFCCFIPGIIGIIFSSQVSSRYLNGDYEGAERASRSAQIWIIVSIVLGLITAPLYLPMLLF